jgi:hypothetical protein
MIVTVRRAPGVVASRIGTARGNFDSSKPKGGNMKLTFRNRLLKLSIAVALSGPALAFAGEPSHPDGSGDLNARLHGSYAITTKRTCVYSFTPIVPDDYFVVDTFRQSAADNGVVTFNGDGTASAVGTSTTLDTSSNSGRLGTVSTFNADIHYTVNADGTVDTSTSSSFNVIFPTTVIATGNATGQAGRLQIVAGGSMLISAASDTYSVETLIYTTGQTTRYRICSRSVVARRISDKQGEQHQHDER